MSHLDDDYLPCRLAAAEKGWEESLEREAKLSLLLKGAVIQAGSGRRLTITGDACERGNHYQLSMSDASTLGEKAVRLELTKVK